MTRSRKVHKSNGNYSNLVEWWVRILRIIKYKTIPRNAPRQKVHIRNGRRQETANRFQISGDHAGNAESFSAIDISLVFKFPPKKCSNFFSSP